MLARKRMVTMNSSSEDDERRYAMMDEKKRKRMISNRDSARRSRMKREEQLNNLNSEVVFLTNQNGEMMRKIREVDQLYVPCESENTILRAECEELDGRLKKLEMMMMMFKSEQPDVSHEINDLYYQTAGNNNNNNNNRNNNPVIINMPWQQAEYPIQFLPGITSGGCFEF